MAPRRHTGAGIRWSSYVGDLRCIATGSSSSSYTFVNYNNCNNKSSSINYNKEQREAREMIRGGIRSFSTSSKQYTTKSKLSTFSSSSKQQKGAPHERLLILGSGVAGCSTALTAARYGIPVTVLHAGSNKNDCNSYWAQGGVIYRNYRLLEDNEKSPEGEGNQNLVDTPLSLVNDIRIASGYTSPLQRSTSIEECTYSSNLHQNTNSNSTSSTSNNLMGQQCPKSGVQWNEDAAWKLACEGPSRIRELLLGTKDDGLGETHGCVVPFDRTTLQKSNENDDNDGLGKDKDGSEDDVLSLCLEASHAAPRIIHYADCTGKVITENITKAAAEHPLIEFVGDSVVTDLILDENSSGNEEGGGMVIGAQVLDKSTNQLCKYYAVHGVVLASGGLAGIYQHSTNPLGFNALGSSVGLALRMQNRLTPSSSFGGRTSSTKKNKSNNIVSDLEYVQFHPTSLYLPNEARFLLTEALRGEGAILRDLDGRAFAHDYHPNGELAPRDIVARAVFCESQKTVDDAEDAATAQHNAYLDITHRDSTWLKDRFPSIDRHLLSRDTPMDFTKERIPIIPAAHYTCGGVTTNLNGCVVGNRNLYAAGEAARTGLHGGNRLASTSLLEGLVYGASVGEMVAGVVKDESDTVALEEREKVMETMHHARHAIEQRLVMEEQQQQSSSSSATADERITQEATSILAHLKSLMWDNVGVVRTPTKLDLAVSELTAIRDQADRLWEEEGAGWEVVALRDAAHAGLAVADAALANRVSGGAHHVVLNEEEEDKDCSDVDDEVVLARA